MKFQKTTFYFHFQNYSDTKDTDECLIDPCGSGECYNTEGSYSCVCHVGFQFDNQTCQDVNECSDGNPCFDGLCENTVGSFTCSCQPGYYLENNTCFGNQLEM